MLIDTHCHLTDQRFENLDKTLTESREAGVTKVIMPSTSVEDSKKVLALAEKMDQYCMVGIHPEEAEVVKDLDREVKELEKLIKSSKVVGVGEVGLDFYYDKEKLTKAPQIDLWHRMVKLALKHNLPLAIHMREAEEEMKTELLAAEVLPRGQFHCFAGSEDFLELVISKGFYVSFCGNITYKSAGRLRDLLIKVPLERLLLETDSPYLPPEPLRGSVNYPGNVKIIAEFIASKLEIESEELARITSQNAKCLYSLES